MLKIDFVAKIDQFSFNRFYYKKLFDRFVSVACQSPFRLRPSYPFNFVYSFFGYLKIDKKTAREIVSFWISVGWCQRAKYRGIKILGKWRI